MVFPGTNCDSDTLDALKTLDVEGLRIDYREHRLPAVDQVIVPGGFSYGDYLRSGALAAQMPVMDAVADAVSADGLPVLGICNGFQILCERGLLPGALRPNISGQFISAWQPMRLTFVPPALKGLQSGEVLSLPIAHHEGCYTLPAHELRGLFEKGRVLAQYSHEDGQVDALSNPNGSIANIAGIWQDSVIGLMPHPERAMAAFLGSRDGRRFLSSWLGKEGPS